MQLQLTEQQAHDICYVINHMAFNDLLAMTPEHLSSDERLSLAYDLSYALNALLNQLKR